MSGIMAMVLGAKTAIAAAVDEFFNRVTLLLPGDGTNGAQNNTFLDSSSNNFTITRNGNTTQGTFSPFSQTGWGNYFDGASNLSAASGPTLSGDFTLEAFVYITTLNSNNMIFGNSGSDNYFGITTSGLAADFGANAIRWNYTFQTNTWYHVAISRSSNTVRAFVNGTQLTLTSGNATDSSTFFSGNILVGRYRFSSALYFTGYISNARLVSGGAIYTGSYTTPTSPLGTTVSAGTVALLTCQSNRFVDNSASALVITVGGGTPSVQAFSPFAPTAAYSAATNGGSGYFDQSGDYLTLPSNTAFAMGTGNFTWEAWVYGPTGTAYRDIFSTRPNATTTSTTAGSLSVNTVNGISWYTNGFTINYNTDIKANQWNHIALCRSGTSLKLYLNGAEVGSATNSDDLTASTLSIGACNNGAQPFNGYISCARIIKGQALTTGSFTPPTAPPTTTSVGWTGANVASSITGTVSLLANFTNAGITDATAKNDLETVGNAQISTTQSKFGGSSMYFDGTGDYLITPYMTLFDMFSGDVTVEGWFYFNSVANAPHLFQFAQPVSGGNSYRVALYVSGSVLRLYTQNGATGADRITSSTTLSTGQWYYIALTKSSGTWTLYLNGNSQGTSTTTVFPSGSSLRCTLGFQSDGSASGDYFNGYIDDFRITRGVARTVTSSPTAAFPLS